MDPANIYPGRDGRQFSSEKTDGLAEWAAWLDKIDATCPPGDKRMNVILESVLQVFKNVGREFMRNSITIHESGKETKTPLLDFVMGVFNREARLRIAAKRPNKKITKVEDRELPI
jgi:hypothetical protein